ncbi:hypothetical protein AB4561_00635 [Vibrio sp. 10N.222.55.A3]|uniref:hypothetical protein n=1 Tax=unclassified Vibrio TaxID=2614977 RepID=UPI001E2B4E7C|nr:hypothetical protein [Vibrio sp. F13]MCC4889814.1 hypothetical protein [Vibrio sp. F13]
MQIANKKDVILEIANRYKLAFPCIKHALETDNARSEIIAVQHRLLTYKEVLLHQSMLDDKEMKQAFEALNSTEKQIVKSGIKTINDTVKEIDEIIEKYGRKSTLELN